METIFRTKIVKFPKEVYKHLLDISKFSDDIYVPQNDSMLSWKVEGLLKVRFQEDFGIPDN